MNKKQAQIIIANAHAILMLPYRNTQTSAPIETFIPEATECLGHIAKVVIQLISEEPALEMGLRVTMRNLGAAIHALPTHNSYTTPDPLHMRSAACKALVNLAELADD